MMDWMNQLTQPQNRESLVDMLANKGAPPPELLAQVGRQGAPQMSQVPGAPGSFSGMLQQAGAPGQVPMQPSPDGSALTPVPPPQMSQVPGMAQPDPGMQQAPAAPLEFGQGGNAMGAGLQAMQMMQLLGQGQNQGQGQPRAPNPPSLQGGTSVRDPQMLQAQAQQGRPTLAQLLYGR